MPIGKSTILCIDPDPSAIWIERRFLRKSGYEVIGASNAHDGLSVLKVASVDAVVLHSQELLDSLLASVAMKQIRPEVRIVMVSDIELPEDAFEIVDARVNKATEPEVLLSTLQSLLSAALVLPFPERKTRCQTTTAAASDGVSLKISER